MPIEIIAIISIVFLSYQIQLDQKWNIYRGKLYECIEKNTGVSQIVNCEITGNDTIRKFNANWTNPYLSILLQAISGQKIKTVIDSKNYSYW